MNFVKFLRTPISIEHLCWLLLNYLKLTHFKPCSIFQLLENVRTPEVFFLTFSGAIEIEYWRKLV